MARGESDTAIQIQWVRKDESGGVGWEGDEEEWREDNVGEKSREGEVGKEGRGEAELIKCREERSWSSVESLMCSNSVFTVDVRTQIS